MSKKRSDLSLVKKPKNKCTFSRVEGAAGGTSFRNDLISSISSQSSAIGGKKEVPPAAGNRKPADEFQQRQDAEW